MLVCDGCGEPMKRPKFVLTQLTFIDPARDMKLPPGMEGMGQSLAPLFSVIPPDTHRDETLAIFDKLECILKWAEKHKDDEALS